MDYLLIGIRAVHFVSTIMVGGVVVFLCLVAEPVLGRMAGELPAAEIFFRRLRWIWWVSLLIALGSGAAWLLVLSANVTGLSLADALFDDATWIMLTQTRFGHAWMARVIIAALIALGAVCFAPRNAAGPRWRRIASLLLAAGFLGGLASSGHAGAEAGLNGEIHWVADFLHLVAAGAWLGGLVPLALVLAMARGAADRTSADIAALVTQRFSVLGMASVGVLAATGIVSTLNLIGSLAELVDTDYGRLLVAKITVFLAMIGIAAVNLLRVTPRLAEDDAKRRLRRNSLIEAGLGMLVLAIVSALGTVPPGLHAQHMH